MGGFVPGPIVCDSNYGAEVDSNPVVVDCLRSERPGCDSQEEFAIHNTHCMP